MPRVYLVYHNRMFGDVMCAVMATQSRITVVGMTDHPAQIAADVMALVPDVILLEETPSGLAVDDLQAILSNPMPHRLITMRLDADGMHVWDQTWRQMAQVQDLMEAILATETTHSGEDET